MDYIDDLDFLKMDIKDNMYTKDFKTMHANIAARRRDNERPLEAEEASSGTAKNIQGRKLGFDDRLANL